MVDQDATFQKLEEFRSRQWAAVLEEAKAKQLSPAATELAKAYGDAWHPKSYGAYILQIVPDAWEKLLADPRVSEMLRSLVDRNLDWRGTNWMSPQEYVDAAKLFVPGYNAFDAKRVGKWLATASGIEVLAARESSVCIYVKGSKEALEQLGATAVSLARADEVSYEAKPGASSKMRTDYEDGDVLRVWWD